MIQTASGEPEFHTARKDYDCEAKPCLAGGLIARGEMYVGEHDYSPVLDANKRPRTNLRNRHFTRKYHPDCFERSTRVGTNAILEYKLSELKGYDRYCEYLQNRESKPR